MYPARHGHLVEGDMLAGCQVGYFIIYVFGHHKYLTRFLQAMGFGGVNIHAFLSSPRKGSEASIALAHSPTALMSSLQDTELFILCGGSVEDLLNKAIKYTFFFFFFDLFF